PACDRCATTAVAMPCSRAMSRPGASARLLTTCVMAPSIAPRAAAPMSALRFEPRPEMRTLMRARAIVADRSGDDRARRTRGPRDDRADELGILSRRTQKRERARRVAGRNAHDHADAAVQHAM